MKKAKHIFLYALCYFLVGCGSLPEADTEIVKNFTPKNIPEGKDVGVYLIRPSLFQGGGRTFWVSEDNQNISRLSNGNYTFLALDSKKNLTVNTHMDGALWSPFEIPNPTIEQKYFYVVVSLADRKAKFINPEIGITAINSMDEDILIEPSKKGKNNNPGFDNLAMNPSFVTDFMQKKINDVTPDDSHGVIYIIRPKNNDPASFWLDGTYAGNLINKQFLRIKVPVGKHYIYKRDGDFNLLEIDIKPNSKYFLTVKQSFGWVTLNNTPTPLDANNAKVKKEIDQWLSTFDEVTLIPNTDLSNNQKRHIKRGEDFIHTWSNDFKKSLTIFPKEYGYIEK